MSAVDVRRLYRYNDWANRKMLDALAGVPAEVYHADAKSSHGGIHGTMQHVIWAHYLWYLRWIGLPADESIAWRKRASTLGDLASGWNDLDARTNAFLDERLTDGLLAEVFTMHTTKGEPYTHTYGDTLHHVVFHSGLHRGQVTSLIRQAGLVPPGTDFIMFARQHPPAHGD